MPGAGGFNNSPNSQSTGQLMQDVLHNPSQQLCEMESFNFSSLHEQLPHDRPEWNVRGITGWGSSVLNSYNKGVFCKKAEFLQGECNQNSFYQPGGTAYLPKVDQNSFAVPVHDIQFRFESLMQTSSEYDRVPTLWKSLHHCSQVISTCSLRDINARLALQQAPCQLLPILSVDISKHDQMQQFVIDHYIRSGEGQKCTQHNKHLTRVNNKTCVCPKNRDVIVREDGQYSGFSSWVFPTESLHKGSKSPANNTHVAVVQGCKYQPSLEFWHLASSIFWYDRRSKKFPTEFTTCSGSIMKVLFGILGDFQPFGQRSWKPQGNNKFWPLQQEHATVICKIHVIPQVFSRDPRGFLKHYVKSQHLVAVKARPITMLWSMRIHRCSCNVRFKRCWGKLCDAESHGNLKFHFSTISICLNDHIDIQQPKNIIWLQHLNFIEYAIINLHLLITSSGYLPWRFVGAVILWITRGLCQIHRQRVVILKQCKVVKGKRVWINHRRLTIASLSHCFVVLTTISYHRKFLDPFTETQKHDSIIRVIVSLPLHVKRNHQKEKYDSSSERSETYKNAHFLFQEFDNQRTKPNVCRSTSDKFRKNPFRGVRVGEAKVPGPEVLDIGNFNPTQLFGKETEIMSWGQGIYCAAETSVTSAALKILRAQFAKQGFHSLWSEPVEPIQPKFSQLRGKASGVAIISSFPIRQFHEPITSAIEDTSRFVDGVVQIGPNCVAYVASIYGAASSSIAIDPIAVTNQLFNFAAERALSFKGPAIISGDFNCYMSDLGAWDAMVQNGWCDAAELDGVLHNRNPQPTSKDAVRKSFILMNGTLSATLKECRTCEDHLFPVHPLLLARCSLHNIISPKLQWVLPKSVDNFIFDPDLFEDAAQDFVTKHHGSFQHAINNSTESASRLFAMGVEHSWKAACVDSEGNRTKISPGHFGRDKLHPLKLKPSSVPVVRKARDGDFEPGLGQPSVEIRRHTRQLRRIESLHAQLVAYNRAPTQGALAKCKQLWRAILDATGFSKSFPAWMCNQCQIFVPINIPHIGYILELKNMYRKWHQTELNKFFLSKIKARKKSILLDIAKGGSRCFEEVRDPAPLHQTFVAHRVKVKVQYTTWPKSGRKILKIRDAEKLDMNFPISFQGQNCRITKIQGDMVHLDQPVRLKSLDLVVEQQQLTADPKQMHDRTFEAWNEHWQRDCADPNDDDWDGVIPYLQHINPVPEMPFENFSQELWEQHLPAVKTKTARGGCGFSAKDMIQFPLPILKWLFEIYGRCEQGNDWPKNWVLTRVSMLAKTSNPTTPFDARPITVFSILYRQWARIRSKQILKHMASYMPRAVSMATCRVPADIAAAYIATMVEDAINNNKKLAGLGIDLKRCFNTLPRWPLTLAMRRMGIPEPYIRGWTSMLANMQRTLWLGSCQSSPQMSTTGAPEGCGFSVVAMAVTSWWQAKTLYARVDQVDSFTYADNWNYVAECPRTIICALEELKHFVTCMRMEISPSKSWLWSTDPKGRKELRGIKVNHETIPVVTSFSDLGCDVQYSKSQRKPKQNKRWDKTVRLCKRIHFSKVPRRYKEHMTVASGLSGAIFGAPITYISKTKWKKLRSTMAQSVRLATAGASSWLSMGCTFNDPQLKSLGYTINFWKRFLNMFPEMVPKFANNMTRFGRTQVGPVACLKKTLNDAGWKVISHAKIQHAITNHQINWQTSSKRHLRFVLERQWCHTIAKAVEHRKDWKQGVADIHLFSQVTSKRSFRDTWILRTAASGKHYTNDIISKYANGVQTTCPFCDQRDGKEHRLWSCNAFRDIRAQYTITLRKVQSQSSNLGIYALPPLQDPIVSLLPCKDVSLGPIQIPTENNHDRYLFLDGTAFGQEYRDLTVSAWAVTEADFNQHNFHSLDKGFVPGYDQSSYRGEVVAILKGFDIIYRGIMYTDCAAALTIFNKLLIARSEGCGLPLVDHDDLWSLVWDHLCGRPVGCVQLVKVKSHQNESTLTDLHENWKAAGNNFVDREAKSVVVQHPIHGRVISAVNRRKQLATLTESFHDYVCKVADKSFLLLKEKRRFSRREAERQMDRPDFSTLVPRRVQPSSGLIPWEDLPRYCPYGEVFYRRFSDWYITIQWPVDAGDGVMGFVSLLELYFNFVVCTGTETPVSTAKRGKPANYKLLDQEVLLQAKTWSLSQHTRVWSLFWNWCLKCNAFVHPPLKASNHFLEHIGYSMQSVCLMGRPYMRHSAATYQTMWDYFHQPEGRRKTTASPLRPLPTCYIDT